MRLPSNTSLDEYLDYLRAIDDEGVRQAVEVIAEQIDAGQVDREELDRARETRRRNRPA